MAKPATSTRLSSGLARRPLVDDVRDAIADEFIRNDEVRPGERLPTEAQLCQRYGVSRITVRAALRGLQETGWINVRQGFGSTVAPRRETIASGIDSLQSFETFAALQGQMVTSAELEIDEVVLDGDDAERLEVDAGTPALVISRTKLHDNCTVGWIVDYVPFGVLPFDTLREEFAGSVLDVLLAHREVGVDHSDCDLLPVSLSTALTRRLAVRRGTAALLFDEVTRTSTGRAVNWSQAWLLPEHFRFQIRRHL